MRLPSNAHIAYEETNLTFVLQRDATPQIMCSFIASLPLLYCEKHRKPIIPSELNTYPVLVIVNTVMGILRKKRQTWCVSY